MKICLISCYDAQTLQVRCPEKEQEVIFFLKLLHYLGHLRSYIGNQIVCNILFRKDDALFRKVQSFCDSRDGGCGKLAELRRFVQNVKDGQHFVFVPLNDDCILSAEDRTNIFVRLASMDTGIERERLILSLNDFEGKVSRYFDIVAVHDVCSSKKMYVGHLKQEDRVCRFCGKSIRADGVSFDKEAHAISELLGNKSLILCDECDTCNNGSVSRLESVLAEYFSPLRALLSVKGKKSYISHVEDNLSVVPVAPHQVAINIAEHLISKREEDGALKIEFDMSAGRIIPQDIYKIFAKYAISVLPNECFSRKEFATLCDWIISDKYVGKLPLICTRVDGRLRNTPSIAVYRRKAKHNGVIIPKYLCELNILASRYLYELPLIENEVFFDSVKRWQNFLWEVEIFGGEMDYSCMDFSDQAKIPCSNHIVFEGYGCNNEEYSQTL